MEKTKIVILYVRPYEFTNDEGETISGFVYGGKKSSGGGITFSSQMEYKKGETVEIELKENWDEKRNRIKYSEKN